MNHIFFALAPFNYHKVVKHRLNQTPKLVIIFMFHCFKDNYIILVRALSFPPQTPLLLHYTATPTPLCRHS